MTVQLRGVSSTFYDNSFLCGKIKLPLYNMDIKKG